MQKTQRIAVVTGSSTGFGKLIVEAFAADGWRVFGTLRNAATVNAAASASLRAAGAEVVELDVLSDASVGAAAATILAAGVPDVLVNNAGNASFGLTEAFTPAAVERQFATNVFGPLRVNRAFVPAMRARRSGLVVYVSSVVGRLALPLYGIYAASKWALEALAETSSYELAPFGIDVAIVEPGDYPTEAFARMSGPDDAACTASYGKLAARFSAALDAARAGVETRDSTDVARAIVRLASAPAGTRPLRTTVPANPAADALNAAVASIQNSVIGALGLSMTSSPRADDGRKTHNGVPWAPTWTQAMTDFRGEGDEPGFQDVTVRMTVPSSLGGSSLRAELSNRFGNEPVRIGRGAIGVGGRFLDIAFGGQRSTEIPAGASRWTDPVDLTVEHGDDVVIDLYLPGPTPYATANGFAFDRSTPGDFVGSPAFPLDGPAAATGTNPEPDGTGWSLPPGGPFLRTIEVAGAEAKAVIVCLGGSSTAMGWPQYTASLLPAAARIAVVNRGIAGNRIRLDAPEATPSWGRAGLSRFDEDVLATNGVTHVVIAYNSNDWGLPGRVTPMDEMPSVARLTDAYQKLIDRARAAGLQAILATIIPLDPELASDPGREGFRLAMNDWIRTSGHEFVDFDAAIRAETEPSRIEGKYAAPDHAHPNVNGEQRLAVAVVEAIARLRI